MSILRISWLPDGLYALDREGNLTITGPYDRGCHKGRMEYFPASSSLVPQLVKRNAALAHYMSAVLKTEAAKLPKGPPARAPVSIFVHGFQFDPTTQVFAEPHHPEADNPHGRLYHWKQFPVPIEIRAHSTSWPLGFGYEEDDRGENGLCIGFGWFSNPDFLGSLYRHGKNFYARAYELAGEAALHLVAVIEVLAKKLPNHPINLICHSLGSRVVIRAIAKMAKERSLDGPNIDLAPRRPDLIKRLNKVIILAGSEKVMEAQLMMGRLNCGVGNGKTIGKLLKFYNFVSRENDVLDVFAENFSPAAPGSNQVIGHNGLEQVDPSWIDIQLDDPDTAAYFAKHGSVQDRGTGAPIAMRLIGDNEGVFAIADHWIHYTWPHNMALYRQILREENPVWDLGALKAATWAGMPGFFNRSKLLRRASTD